MFFRLCVVLRGSRLLGLLSSILQSKSGPTHPCPVTYISHEVFLKILEIIDFIFQCLKAKKQKIPQLYVVTFEVLGFSLQTQILLCAFL